TGREGDPGPVGPPPRRADPAGRAQGRRWETLPGSKALAPTGLRTGDRSPHRRRPLGGRSMGEREPTMRTPPDPAAARAARLERNMRVLRADFDDLRNAHHRRQREVKDRAHSIHLLSRQIEGVTHLLESASAHVTELIRRPSAIARSN